MSPWSARMAACGFHSVPNRNSRDGRLALDVGIEEEPPGLGDDREDDADRGQDGDQRAHQQHDEDEALEEIARPEQPVDARQDQRQGAERQRQAGNEDGPGAHRMHARIGVGRLAHNRIDRHRPCWPATILPMSRSATLRFSASRRDFRWQDRERACPGQPLGQRRADGINDQHRREHGSGGEQSVVGGQRMQSAVAPACHGNPAAPAAP